MTDPADTCFANEGEGVWHIYGPGDSSLCNQTFPVYEPGSGTKWAMLETEPTPLCKGCKGVETDHE